MGNPVFFSRALAALNATRKGVKAFRTFQPMQGMDKTCWTYEERPDGPGIQYAKAFAEGKDFIHHVEIDKDLRPILVVSCFREEIIEPIPELFVIEPLTPELWAAARAEYPDVRPFKKPSLVAHPDRPLPNSAGRFPQPDKPAAASRANPPAAAGANGNGASKRNGGVVDICRALMTENPDFASDRKAFIAAALERGVIQQTAATQWYRLRR